MVRRHSASLGTRNRGFGRCRHAVFTWRSCPRHRTSDHGGLCFDHFIDVREPVFYGPDVDRAFDALTDLYLVKDALAQTDEAPDKTLQRLRDLLEAHMTSEGVLFDSRAWIITAHRRTG